MEKHGFLEIDSDQIILELENEYPGLWDLAMETNILVNQHQYSLSANTNNIHELIGAPLFIRTVSNYQALLILISKGMLQQSHIMLRALVEALFPLVAISKNNQFANEYINHDEYSRKSVLGKLKRYKETLNEVDPNIQVTSEVINAIKNNITENNIHYFSAEELSRKANLHSWYDTVYAITSAAVHTTPRSLEAHLVVDSDGETIKEFKNEPDIQKIDTALSTGINAMHIAMEACCDIFSENHPEELSGLNERLESSFVKKPN